MRRRGTAGDMRLALPFWPYSRRTEASGPLTARAGGLDIPGKPMIARTCNLWIEPAEYRCILTSGAVSRSGEAVLESRSARAAGARFAGLAADLGRLLAARGNHVHLIRPGLVSFPIKQYEWADPSAALIERSARELCALVGPAKTLLPHPGAAEGSAALEALVKTLASLPDNIIVVNET